MTTTDAQNTVGHNDKAEPRPAYVNHDWLKHDDSGLRKSCKLCSVRVDRLGHDLWWSLPGEKAKVADHANPVPSCTGQRQYTPAIPNIPRLEAKPRQTPPAAGKAW